MTEDLLISAIPGKEKWREGRIEEGRGEQRSNEEEEEKWRRKEKEKSDKGCNEDAHLHSLLQKSLLKNSVGSNARKKEEGITKGK